MDSKQTTAAREDLDTLMQQMRGYPPSRVAAVVWDWMKAQGFRDEKAHTPTDDEREALLTEADALVASWDQKGSWSSDSPVGMVMRLAAALRRSEVPEPSAEEWTARINAARQKAIAKGYTLEHDAKHGVRHLLRWAIDYARRGRAEDSSGMVAAAIDLADIAYAELERLRHVADTMSAVSEALRTRYASDSQAAYFMRQIDAALEAVPEPHDEPSDAQTYEPSPAAIEAARLAYEEAFEADYDAEDCIAFALRAAEGVR